MTKTALKPVTIIRQGVDRRRQSRQRGVSGGYGGRRYLVGEPGRWVRQSVGNEPAEGPASKDLSALKKRREH